MDYEKLIERLQQYSQSLIAYKLDADFADACEDAVAAISTLQAENARLMFRDTKLEDTIRSQRMGLMELRAELEKVKAERDEAREAICTHCQDVPCRGDYCYWWRGQKED